MAIKPAIWLLAFPFVLFVSSTSLLFHIDPVYRAALRRACQHEHYAFDPVSGKCWELNTRGPCGVHMTFERVDGYPLGSCKCFHEDNPCNQRYVVISNPTQNCYKYFTQGPCTSDEWLVPTYFNDERTARCAKNVCLGRMNDVIEDHAGPYPHPKFFFGHEGICYVTGTQAFCPPGQVALFVNGAVVPDCYPQHDSDTKICTSQPPSHKARSKRELLDPFCGFCPGPGGECPPGYEKDDAGECAPVDTGTEQPAPSTEQPEPGTEQLDTSSEQADYCEYC